jgi:hypothetical protein
MNQSAKLAIQVPKQPQIILYSPTAPLQEEYTVGQIKEILTAVPAPRLEGQPHVAPGLYR